MNLIVQQFFKSKLFEKILFLRTYLVYSYEIYYFPKGRYFPEARFCPSDGKKISVFSSV